MLGKLLADSGEANQIVDKIIDRVGVKTLPWAMALIAGPLFAPPADRMVPIAVGHDKIPHEIKHSERKAVLEKADWSDSEADNPQQTDEQIAAGAKRRPSFFGALISVTLPVLLLGWLVAVAIRLATGSATVATVTAAGIVAPLGVTLDEPHLALLVLAVGAGSLFFSHVNDAGFWLVKEYFGLTVGQTIKTWSVMETIVSVVALIVVLILGAIV